MMCNHNHMLTSYGNSKQFYTANQKPTKTKKYDTQLYLKNNLLTIVGSSV